MTRRRRCKKTMNPGRLLVKGGDSKSRGREFESRRQTLDGHF